jgi:hypothetical protein
MSNLVHTARFWNSLHHKYTLRFKGGGDKRHIHSRIYPLILPLLRRFNLAQSVVEKSLHTSYLSN